MKLSVIHCHLFSQVCHIDYYSWLKVILTIILVAFAPSIGTCTHGDLKLVGDDDCDEGLVEVCLNGHWGTVNIEGWDANEATVVCKQLGYYARG